MSYGKHIAQLILLLAIPFSVQAGVADYQSEISLGYQNEDETDGDGKSKVITAIYYLDTVTPDINQPLAEAEFLQRVSGLGVGYLSYDGRSDIDQFDGDATIIAYSHMQKDSPYSFLLGYLDQQEEGRVLGFSYVADIETRIVGVGYFLTETSMLTLGYQKKDVSYEGLFDFLSYQETETYLSGKNVHQNGDGTALNLEAAYGVIKQSDGDKNAVFGIEADYYLNTRQSIGVMFETESGDIAYRDGKTIGLRAKIFLTPQLSASIELSKFSASDVSYDDEDTIDIEGAYRF